MRDHEELHFFEKNNGITTRGVAKGGFGRCEPPPPPPPPPPLRILSVKLRCCRENEKKGGGGNKTEREIKE